MQSKYLADSTAGIDNACPEMLSILIVDDSQDAAQSLLFLFEAVGYKAETAGSGQAALAVGERLMPAVVLLDIGLPDLSGHEVATQIRNTPWGKKALLIALTGWGEKQDRARSVQAGFDHHLVKPVDIEVLLKMIATSASTR